VSQAATSESTSFSPVKVKVAGMLESFLTRGHQFTRTARAAMVLVDGHIGRAVQDSCSRLLPVAEAVVTFVAGCTILLAYHERRFRREAAGLVARWWKVTKQRWAHERPYAQAMGVSGLLAMLAIYGVTHGLGIALQAGPMWSCAAGILAARVLFALRENCRHAYGHVELFLAFTFFYGVACQIAAILSGVLLAQAVAISIQTLSFIAGVMTGVRGLESVKVGLAGA